MAAPTFDNLAEKFHKSFSENVLSRVESESMQSLWFQVAGEEDVECELQDKNEATWRCCIRLRQRRLQTKCSCGESGCIHLWHVLNLAIERHCLQPALKRNVKAELLSWDAELPPVAKTKKNKEESSPPFGSYSPDEKKGATPQAFSSLSPVRGMNLSQRQSSPHGGPAPGGNVKNTELARNYEQPSKLGTTNSSLVQKHVLLQPSENLRFYFVCRLDSPSDLEIYWKSGDGKILLLADLSGGLVPTNLEATVQKLLDKRLLRQFSSHEGKSLKVSLPEDASAAEVLQELQNSGRLFTRQHEQDFKFIKVKVVTPAELKIDSQEQGDFINIRAQILLPNEGIIDLPPQQAAGTYLRGEELFTYDCHGAANLLKSIISQSGNASLPGARAAGGEIILSHDELPEFAWKNLRGLDAKYFALPPVLHWQQSDEEPRASATFRIAEFKIGGAEALHADIEFLYGDSAVAWNSDREFAGNADQSQLSKRNRRLELQLIEEMKSQEFFYLEKSIEPGWKMKPAQLASAVANLICRGWEFFAEGKSLRLPREMIVKAKTGGEEGEGDLMQLQVEADFADVPASLREILKSISEGSQLVRLDDGSLGLLPQEWLAQFTLLTEIGEWDGEGLSISRSRALMIEMMLRKQGVNLQGSLSDLPERLKSFEKLLPTQPHAEFDATLRPYQQIGLAWLNLLRSAGLGGILADDMGLGKTIQMLAYMHNIFKEDPSATFIGILPKSLIFNWQQEVEKFCQELPVYVFHGGGRDARILDRPGLHLTTYGTMLSSFDDVRARNFEVCFLDEAQAIKNPDAQTAKAARLLQAKQKICMSGTPVENSILDLWSLMDFCNPGLLGERGLFLKNFRGATLDEMLQRIAGLMLRRRKIDVAKELPPKTEQLLVCPMPAEQNRLYQQLRAYYHERFAKPEEGEGEDAGSAAVPGGSAGKGNSPGAGGILGALTRMRMAACAPELIDDSFAGQASAKMDVLLPKLTEIRAEGNKVLIFSQFTSFLDLIQGEVEKSGWKYERIDGSVADRSSPVKRFQEEDDVGIFLISLKAGGTGLNLTAASYVFLMDPWWNPAAEAQAVDRAYRIGQKNPVTAYKLVCEGTLEEKILLLQAQKAQLAGQVENAAMHEGALSRSDMMALLDL